MPGINYNSNWPAIWRRKRWFGIEYKLGIRIFEYVPTTGDTIALKGGVFTRGTAATYYLGSVGDNIPRRIATAPVDTIREEHWTQWRDLSTENPLRQGALIERAATNVATFSEDFTNAVWTKVGVTVSADTLPIPIEPSEPDTGDSVLEDNSNGLHQIERIFTPGAAGDPIAASVFVEPIAAGQYIQVVIEDANDPTKRLRIIFDEVDQGYSEDHQGAVIVGGVSVDRNITGWSRLCVGGSIPGATDYKVIFGILDLAQNESYQGVPGVGTGMWGAQVELGDPYITSYIRTLGAAPGVRAADVLYFNWPLTKKAIPMSVLLRFQDQGSHIEAGTIYDHLGDDTVNGSPYLTRRSAGIVDPNTGAGNLLADHVNTTGNNDLTAAQEILTQYTVDSMTRLYDTGNIVLEQTVEGGNDVISGPTVNDIGLEDWAGNPNGVLWIGGVNGANMGAIVLFQLRITDNPDSTFISSQRPVLFETGLNVDALGDFAFAEDQINVVEFDETDPDAEPGYAVLVDTPAANPELIQEELGFYFIDDGI